MPKNKGHRTLCGALFNALMFRSEVSPITTFEGFAVKCFRQGRTNLAERRLSRSHILFAPAKGVVGVFLASPAESVEEAALRAAWRAQGSPRVALPDERHFLLFGHTLPIVQVPFAGYDDLWLEEGRLNITFKRKPDAQAQATRLASFARVQLLNAANEVLASFAQRVPRLPRSLQIRPLRPRILGQCTREGDIYLNASLHQWSREVMAETVAHELVHLEHFNHSSAFWARLTELLPDWLPRSLAHYL